MEIPKNSLHCKIARFFYRIAGWDMLRYTECTTLCSHFWWVILSPFCFLISASVVLLLIGMFLIMLIVAPIVSYDAWLAIFTEFSYSDLIGAITSSILSGFAWVMFIGFFTSIASDRWGWDFSFFRFTFIEVCSGYLKAIKNKVCPLITWI